MISQVARIAGTMASYALGASATRKAASWSLNLLRKNAAVLARNAEKQARPYLKRAATTTLKAVGTRSKSGSIYKSAKRFESRITKNLSKKSLGVYGAVRENVLEEAAQMPVNYMMYRVERSRAVSPEDKQRTSSFGKWYFKDQMLTSVVAGTALTMGTRKAKGLPKRLGKAIGRKRLVRGVKAGLSASEFVSKTVNKAKIMSTASKKSFRGLSPSKMLNPDVRKKVFRSVKYNLKTESNRIKHLKRLDPVGQSISRDHFSSKIISEVSSYRRNRAKELEKFKRKHFRGEKVTKQENFDSFSSRFHEDTNRISKTMINEYNNQARQSSGVMNFVNKVLSNNTNLKVEKHTSNFNSKDYFVNKDPGVKPFANIKDFVKDPGLIKFDKRTYDLRNFNTSTFKTAAIKMLNRGVIGKVSSLFGVDDILNFHLPENQNNIAYKTFNKPGMLVLPASNKATSKLFEDAIIGDYHPEAKRDFANSFFNSRVALIKQHPDLQKANRKTESNLLGSKTLTKGYLKSFMEHGTLPMGHGDMLIHAPGGKMYIQSKVTQQIEGKSKISTITMDVAKMFPGHDLKFLKYTSQESSTTKSMRRALGYQERDIIEKGEQLGTIHIGPSHKNELVKHNYDQSMFGKLKRVLDLGNSEETGVVSKVKRIFGKFTDPSHAPTLFSKDFLLDSSGRNMLFGGDTNTSIANASKVYSVIQKQEEQLWDNFYGTYIRSPKSDIGGKALRNLGYQQSNRTDMGNFINYDEPLVTAKNKVENLINKLKSSSDKAVNPYERDLQSLYRLKELMVDSPGKIAGDVLGTKDLHRKIRKGVNVSSLTHLEAYNSTVLRHSLDNIDRTKINVSNGQFRIYDAASHMSDLKFKLSKEISDITVDKPETDIINSLGNVNKIIGDFTGSDKTQFNNTMREMSKSYKNWNISWSGSDTRMKSDSLNQWENTYLISSSPNFSLVKSKVLTTDRHDRNVEVADGMLDVANLSIMNMMHSINKVASQIGLGFDEREAFTPGKYAKKIISQRILPAAGLLIGYNALDETADFTMDGTPFGEGIGMFFANTYANARIGSAGIMDTLGVTSASKWAEDLMPGVVNSPLSGIIRGFGSPLAGVSLGFKAGGPAGALMGGLVGTSVSMLTAGGPLAMFGNWNLDKSRKEVIEELKGEKEVAVRKGRFWELSSNPFSGTGVKYFRPHAYAMMRSEYKETPGLKDSVISNLVGGIAPDYFGVKNYYSRPYPVTAGIGSNIPILSDALSMIPGLPIGGNIQMHEDYIDKKIDILGSGNNIESEMGSLPSIDSTGNYFGDDGSLTGPYGERVIDSSNMEWSAGQTMRNMQNIIGMRGFIFGTALEKMSGQKELFNTVSLMENPGEISSASRDYWDMNLGGLLGTNEIIRRFLPDKRKDMQYYNPIVNDAPEWLPGAEYYVDFKHGDKFTKVDQGEARLPGAGYMTSHSVKLDFPMDADSMGQTIDSQVAYYLSLPEYMQPRNEEVELARDVAKDTLNQMKMAGALLKENQTIYDPTLNLTANIDAMSIDRTPIKVAAKGHGAESSLNAFLVLSGADHGSLLEVDTDTGGITERQVKRDMAKFERDVRLSTEAIDIARDKIPSLEKSMSTASLANAYSWQDRMDILADIAPYSKKFKTAKNIVETQIKSGQLSNKEIMDYEVTLDQVDQQSKTFNFQEYRFLNLGKSLTDYGRQRDRDVLNQYSAPEILLGSAWEGLSHIKNPISNKLLWNMDPLEAYESMSIYGKRMKNWNSPVEDFVKSHIYENVSNDSIIESAVGWSTAGAVGGMLMGGLPLSAALGAGAVGGIFGMGNKIGTNDFIPERTQDRRDIERQVDAIEYTKYMKLFNETGNRLFLNKAKSTMAYSVANNEVIETEDLKYHLGYSERPFMEDIIKNVNSDNIDRVRALLPKEVLPTLDSEIGRDTKDSMNIARNLYQDTELPGMNSSLYDPNVNPELIAIEEYENEGLSSYESGIGFYNHMKELHKLKSSSVYNPKDTIRPLNGATFSELNTSLKESSTLRNKLARYSTRVNIFEDSSDTINLEVIVD